MSILDKLSKAGPLDSVIMSDSILFDKPEFVQTKLPILNVAFSGRLDGGMVSGFTVFAGESKSFKTLLALYCLKSYFDKYPDAVCVFYDSEFGSPPSYLKSFDIDPNRILHIPVSNVEELKFDIVKKLEAIKRGERVFFFIDSLGNLPSKKEVEDAIEEKSVSDMTRAKAIRSLIRMMIVHLNLKDIPCVCINHVYKTMEMYSKDVVGGGTAVTYGANQIFIITKAQEKDGKDLVGYKFTINIEKSRFVKEKSKFPFTVTYKDGIKKWSGLFEIALDGGFITNPKQGWYSLDGQTNKRRADIESDDEYWKGMLDNEDFKKFISDRYILVLDEEEIKEV